MNVLGVDTTPTLCILLSSFVELLVLVEGLTATPRIKSHGGGPVTASHENGLCKSHFASIVSLPVDMSLNCLARKLMGQVPSPQEKPEGSRKRKTK